MELLYSVKKDKGFLPSHQLDPDRTRNLSCQRVCCLAVSSANLIAFTSNANLLKTKFEKKSVQEPHLGSHVYVSDLNTPWELYLVKSSKLLINHIRWSHTGTEILICHSSGQVELYGMKNHLINQWQLINLVEFGGEGILNSCWLNLPRKVSCVPEKLDSMLYSEKYRTALLPCLNKGFGGKYLDGFVVVTSTGLVGTHIRPHDDSNHKFFTVMKSLPPTRTNVSYADMAYSPDGCIVIATGSTDPSRPINVSKLHISLRKFGREKPEIHLQSCQSLFLKGRSSFDSIIKGVKFPSATSSEKLMVFLNSRKDSMDTSSTLCLFELGKQSIPVRGRFSSAIPSDQTTVSNWQQTSEVYFKANIIDVCNLPSNLLEPSLSGSNLAHSHTIAVLTPITAVSLTDGSVALLKSENLQQLGINPVLGGSVNAKTTEIRTGKIKREREIDEYLDGIKFQKLSTNSRRLVKKVNFEALGFSWSGSILVAVDSYSNFHVLKMHQHQSIDPGTATILLELSMIGGFDPWDILMCLKMNLLENIIDRLSETFCRQPSSVQSQYSVRILVLKSALARLSHGGITGGKGNDQQTLLTLHLISGALKALLRPSDLSSPDKMPAESLSGFLTANRESLSDLDKVLMNLIAKEYTVEPSTLQSLQPLLQWCADLTLKLLSSLPESRHPRTASSHWELCRDAKAIGSLRELIVLMRIWGLIRPSCLPSFRKTSESLDVLPLLFRLLTRLSVSQCDPDDSLIDECCLLPSEVQIPSYNAYSPFKTHGVASTAFFSKCIPLEFKYGTNPSHAHSSLMDNSRENWMDGLRLLWLGRNPAGVKVCNRCGCATLINLPPKSAANKAWDQRWIRHCPCGGHWKIPSYLPQLKISDSEECTS